MSFGKHIHSLAKKAKEEGTHVNLAWIEDLIDAELPKWRKRSVTAEAEQVYALYPIKVGRAAALLAIQKALTKKPLQFLLDRTQTFAQCVSRWPASYRYNQQGRDCCPHPATWFNQARYDDDPETWARVGGRQLPVFAKEQMVATASKAPAGWKAWVVENTSFDLEGKEWEDLEPAHQKYIAENVGRKSMPIKSSLNFEGEVAKILGDRIT